MKSRTHILCGLVFLSFAGTVLGQEEKRSSYAPVVPKEDFAATMSRMSTEKAAVMKKQRGGWPDQDVSAARHQRFAHLFARWPTADAGGHGGIFNLILETKLSAPEKTELVAFLGAL